MMNLSDAEKLFMDEFREKKYHPKYLFEDSGIVDRLSKHPMAMWKMQNTDKSASLWNHQRPYGGLFSV
jgi:hypothetical protein